MNVRRNRRRVAIAAAAAFVASLVGFTAATADSGLSSAEALQRAAGTTEPYTAIGDYVDTLIYWHHHTDWSV
jgi:hypothetical protein